MSITQAIHDAIKQNLPSAVASELSEFIEEAKRDKAKLHQVEEAWRGATKLLEEAEDRNKKLVETLKAYENLETREKAVLERENRLDVTLAEFNRDRAIDMTDKIFKLAEIAFRNPRLVHSESGFLPVSGGANPNAYPGSFSYNKTSVVEDTK